MSNSIGDAVDRRALKLYTEIDKMHEDVSTAKRVVMSRDQVAIALLVQKVAGLQLLVDRLVEEITSGA